MGIFNDPNSVNAFLINAYCIVSALFFSACAYAQLNDPNPVQWFCAYVFGGTIPNLYWMTSGGSTSFAMRQKLVLALHGFVAGMGLAIVYKLVMVAPKLLEDVTQHHHGFLWAFMEHEEGRDSIGLLLLILHVSYLNSVLSREPFHHPRGSPRANGSSNGANGSARPTVPPAVVAVGLFGILGLCVYVWIVHHPDLVAKHGLKHCQGEMFGRTGGEL